MENKYNEAKKILEKYNQTHLLSQYDKLDDEKKEQLLNQIINIDFEQLNKLYEQTKKEIEMGEDLIEPISYIEKASLLDEEKEKYSKIGADEIKNGKFAVVTMAGGQGTRLGHDGPKGTYVLNIKPNPKSIFEILCDNLKEAKKKYNVAIPWYIMTSKENNKQTVEFFEKNNYFDYPKEAVRFFIQGELPMLDTEGKILLDENGTVKQAANGHGGTLESMDKEKVIETLKKEGVEWIFVSGVDNVLAKLVDPLLLGMSINSKVLGAVKSVEKTDPKESVGVFCRKNKRVGVVEYTEISEEMANERNEKGSLVYGDLNAVFHLYNIKALEKVCNLKLPYHIAFKKAKYLDENGKLIVPEKPNAYKFEMFIFDSFEMLDDVLVLRVKREEEFAPVKNREGNDSVDTAIELYNKYHNM